jgi:DNA-binding CsgD family transcriptional regulator/tetratricopeptide (TPR) repeat protein
MMERAPAIAQGRAAFRSRRWREAHARLSAADRALPLEPDDLERLAAAAYLVGEDSHAVAVWTRAHHRLVDEDQVERAAQCGFWLSLHFLLAGEMARSTGWLARSERLLRDREAACVARGYRLIVLGLLALGGGNAESAGASFEQALALAERFRDSDLLALSLLGSGQSLIASRKRAEGVARLDEAMVAVAAGEVSPVLAGIVYCAVILTCQDIFDIARAREWTRQLDAWCASQPDLVPYRGQCLVHRSQLLQLQGDWREALAEVTKAREHLAERSEAVVGRACYQQGELHRLRGEYAQAEQMYHEAARNGREPQPGMALLRLAEGKSGAAAAAIRGAIGPVGSQQGRGAMLPRPELLAACAEISIAAGDLGTARAASDELMRIADEIDAPFLRATSAQATGAVLFAEGSAQSAGAALREALAIWQQLETPYEAARARALIGAICQRLGDRETASMHFGAARSVFTELGAARDLVELERLMATGSGAPLGTLTGREREVLSLVASGQPNRQIAGALGISEHTVARHLSNIFDKLGVTSRTAAGAMAHRHNLV